MTSLSDVQVHHHICMRSSFGCDVVSAHCLGMVVLGMNAGVNGFSSGVAVSAALASPNRRYTAACYPRRVAAGAERAPDYKQLDGRGQAAKSAPRAYRFIDLKNSALFLVARSLSSRNSMASASSMGCRSLRRSQIFCSSAGSVSSSSRRVPERLMMIDG